MKEKMTELEAKGWKHRIVPFHTMESPDGEKVAMKCMTCDQVISGVMMAHGGLVQCRRCIEKGGERILRSAASSLLDRTITELLRKLIPR